MVGRARMVLTVTLVTAQWVLLEITAKQVACPCSRCQSDIHRINKLLIISSLRLAIFFTDIDDCVNHTCSNNGSCEDGVNSYSCNCQEGYSGDHCETGKLVFRCWFYSDCFCKFHSVGRPFSFTQVYIVKSFCYYLI